MYDVLRTYTHVWFISSAPVVSPLPFVRRITREHSYGLYRSSVFFFCFFTTSRPKQTFSSFFSFFFFFNFVRQHNFDRSCNHSITTPITATAEKTDYRNYYYSLFSIRKLGAINFSKKHFRTDHSIGYGSIGLKLLSQDDRFRSAGSTLRPLANYDVN